MTQRGLQHDPWPTWKTFFAFCTRKGAHSESKIAVVNFLNKGEGVLRLSMAFFDCACTCSRNRAYPWSNTQQGSPGRWQKQECLIIDWWQVLQAIMYGAGPSIHVREYYIYTLRGIEGWLLTTDTPSVWWSKYIIAFFGWNIDIVICDICNFWHSHSFVSSQLSICLGYIINECLFERGWCLSLS